MTQENRAVVSRRDFLAVGSLGSFTLLSASVVAKEGWGVAFPQGLTRTDLARVRGGFVPFEAISAPRAKRLLERITTVDSRFRGNDAMNLGNDVMDPGNCGVDRGNDNMGRVPTGTAEEERAADPITAMVDPCSFEEGDSLFVERGVRLSVWGVVPAVFEDVPDVIDVDVLFEPFHPYPFTAWGFRKSPTWTLPGPRQLNVPVDPARGLNLSVLMRWGNLHDRSGRIIADREVARRVHFAVAPESGAPKLLPGVHLIPLFESGRDDLARLSQGGAMPEFTTPMLLLETQYGSQQAATPA